MKITYDWRIMLVQVVKRDVRYMWIQKILFLLMLLSEQVYDKLLMLAKFLANQHKNTVRTIDYVPKVTYNTYFKSHFTW